MARYVPREMRVDCGDFEITCAEFLPEAYDPVGFRPADLQVSGAKFLPSHPTLLVGSLVAHAMKARGLGRGTTAGNDGKGMILAECMTEFEPTGRFRRRLRERFFQEYSVRPPHCGGRQNGKSLLGTSCQQNDRHSMAACAWLLPIPGWHSLFPDRPQRAAMKNS